MPLSRPFRALVRLTGLWSLPWIAGGLALGTIRWLLSPDLRDGPTTLPAWLLNHALAFGSLGVISGLWLGLLLARIAHGSSWSQYSRRRVAFWGAVAGVFPVLLFAGLGVAFAAPASSLLALVGLGALSSLASSVLATSTHAVATTQALEASTDRLLRQ